jgi:hypothetical protein
MPAFCSLEVLTHRAAFSIASAFVSNGPLGAFVDTSTQYQPSDRLSVFPKNTPTFGGTLLILPPFHANAVSSVFDPVDDLATESCFRDKDRLFCRSPHTGVMANGLGFGLVAEATANYTRFPDKVPAYPQGKALA